MDSPDYLPILLSSPVLYFLVFSFSHFLVFGSVRQINLTCVSFRAHVKIASRIVSSRKSLVQALFTSWHALYFLALFAPQKNRGCTLLLVLPGTDHPTVAGQVRGQMSATVIIGRAGVLDKPNTNDTITQKPPTLVHWCQGRNPQYQFIIDCNSYTLAIADRLRRIVCMVYFYYANIQEIRKTSYCMIQ